MADLYAAVVAELDRLDPHRLTTLGKVGVAVLKLHAPEGPEDRPTCKTCVVLADRIDDAGAWTEEPRPAPAPCSTIQAIARELEVSA